MIRRSEISNRNHLNTRIALVTGPVNTDDEVIFVDCTAGAVTLTLPDAVGNRSMCVRVKKTDSSATDVTIATVNSQTIDGASTIVIPTQNDSVGLVSDGTNWQTISIPFSVGEGTFSAPATVSGASASALTVGANGATNPVLQVATNVASVATGLSITGNAAGAAQGLNVAVISSGTNEALTIDAKGSGTINLGQNSTGGIFLKQRTTVTSVLGNAFAVGANGVTNPVFLIDASVASVATGVKITGAAAGAGVTIAAISSGTDEGLKIDSKGAGSLLVGSISTGAIQIGGGGGNIFITKAPRLNSGEVSLTAGGVLGCWFGNTQLVGIYFGSGAPTVSAAKGSLYLRSDGSTVNDRMYVNTNGTTGWAAVTTAS